MRTPSRRIVTRLPPASNSARIEQRIIPPATTERRRSRAQHSSSIAVFIRFCTSAFSVQFTTHAVHSDRSRQPHRRRRCRPSPSLQTPPPRTGGPVHTCTTSDSCARHSAIASAPENRRRKSDRLHSLSNPSPSIARIGFDAGVPATTSREPSRLKMSTSGGCSTHRSPRAGRGGAPTSTHPPTPDSLPSLQTAPPPANPSPPPSPSSLPGEPPTPPPAASRLRRTRERTKIDASPTRATPPRSRSRADPSPPTRITRAMACSSGSLPARRRGRCCAARESGEELVDTKVGPLRLERWMRILL